MISKWNSIISKDDIIYHLEYLYINNQFKNNYFYTTVLAKYGALANQTPASAPARLIPTGVNLYYSPPKIAKAIQAFCVPISIFVALKGWLSGMNTESIDYQKHFITFFPFDGIIIT